MRVRRHRAHNEGGICPSVYWPGVPPEIHRAEIHAPQVRRTHIRHPRIRPHPTIDAHPADTLIDDAVAVVVAPVAPLRRARVRSWVAIIAVVRRAAARDVDIAVAVVVFEVVHAEAVVLDSVAVVVEAVALLCRGGTGHRVGVVAVAREQGIADQHRSRAHGDADAVAVAVGVEIPERGRAAGLIDGAVAVVVYAVADDLLQGRRRAASVRRNVVAVGPDGREARTGARHDQRARAVEVAVCVGIALDLHAVVVDEAVAIVVSVVADLGHAGVHAAARVGAVVAAIRTVAAARVGVSVAVIVLGAERARVAVLVRVDGVVADLEVAGVAPGVVIIAVAVALRHAVAVGVGRRARAARVGIVEASLTADARGHARDAAARVGAGRAGRARLCAVAPESVAALSGRRADRRGVAPSVAPEIDWGDIVDLTASGEPRNQTQQRRAKPERITR